MVYDSLELAMDDALDEVLDSVSSTAKDSILEAIEFGVDDSPVDTGRFQSNWYAVVDQESAYRNEDKYNGASATISDAKNMIDKFDAKENEFIYVYNNVSDGEEDYAATVSFDSTQGRAQGIMEDMEGIAESMLVGKD